MIYILLYFKISLIIKEWNEIFKYRIFGIVYSIVLIINNIYIFVWFRNMELIIEL